MARSAFRCMLPIKPSPMTAIRIETDMVAGSCSYVPLLHVVDLEVEALGRQTRYGIRRHMGPRLKSGGSKSAVQIEKKLIGEAGDGWRLAEGQAQTNSLLQLHSVSINCCVGQ